MQPVENMTIREASQKTPVLGILSIVFGAVSLLPLVGIISPVGFVLGVIGILRGQRITGLIGTALSLVGMATSPILWAVVTGLAFKAMCGINPSDTRCVPPVTVEAPAVQPSAVETVPAQPAVSQ